MAIGDRLRSAFGLVGLLAVTVASGCHLDLMHTPVGYTTGVIDPFADLRVHGPCRRGGVGDHLEKIENHIAYYFPHDYQQQLAPILVRLIPPD
jgi:hypothetical protein